MKTDASTLAEIQRKVGQPLTIQMEGDRCVALDLTSKNYLYHGLIRHHSVSDKQQILQLISQLSNLQRLNLQRNKVHTLPESFCQLQNLRWLNLGSNALEKVPAELRFFRRLKFLHLGSNDLNELPEFMSNLRELEYLTLHKNMRLKCLGSLAGLEQIRHLNLHYLNLHVLPEFVYRYKELVTLTVWNIHGFSDQMGNLQNLEFFSACGCHRLRHLPPALTSLKKIRMLRLFKNDLQELPEDFGALEQLEQLSLYQNALQKLPDSFSLLTQLKKLNLGCNRFTRIPSCLSQCESLRWLAVFGNPLEDPARPALPAHTDVLETWPYTTS